MPELLFAPDLEELTRGYLAEILGVPVSLRDPEGTPDVWVKLWANGGERNRLIHSQTLEVEVWARKEITAAETMNQVLAAVVDLGQRNRGGWQITQTAAASGMVSLPDIRFPNLYRYVTRVEITARVRQSKPK